MRKHYLLALCGALALGWAGNAQATVMRRLSLETMVGRADHIVVGEVVAQRAFYGPRGRIYTESTLRVEQTVQGKATKTVKVLSLGGTVGRIGMRVSGAVSLRKGQRVLAFTEARSRGRYIVGMRQGLFHITQDSAGEPVVRRSLAGLTFARPAVARPAVAKPAVTKAAPPSLDRVLRLSSFVEAIKQTAARCAKRQDRCLPARYRR